MIGRRVIVLTWLLAAAWCPMVSAHHVLGRPAYSLNEDSNTPPSMEVETQIGAYFVTYMVFPAFPRAGEPGRVNLYASSIDTGEPFMGQVTFSARDDTWFGAEEEPLGTQLLDDAVYRQGFQFQEDGDYIVTARFEADGEPYIIDFPLRVGEPSPLGPLGIAVGVILLALVAVSVVQRRRLGRLKVRAHHASLRSEAPRS